MPRLALTQPLPQDLRNQSFKGMNCEGWDFAGRDIRGCNFSNAKLKSADFSKATAGRSQKQIIISLLVAGVDAGVVAIIFAGAGAFVGAFSFRDIFAFVASFSFASAFTIGSVFVVAAISVGVFVGIFAIIFAVVFAGAVISAFAGLRAIEAFGNGQILLGLGFSVLAILCFSLAHASAGKAIQEVKNATGTNFKGADLTGVDFSHATLNNCNFEQADISHVNWSHVEGTRSTIDFTHTRMQLLVSRKGTNGIYSDLDISDRHLAGVDLIKANLSGADLTCSNLEHADLTYANLTNVKAGGTDFRRANLTGACIQNWTINSDTQFDDLTCDYIHLTPDQDRQNRRPLSGSFEPGDFEKLVDKFADTLDFILRRGTDPIAFTQALNQFKQDNPEARIKALLELDPDRVLVQATVPEGSDKVGIYAAFQNTQTKLQAANEKIRYLEGKTEANKENQEFISQLFGSCRPDIKLIQAHQMTDESSKTHAGGDIISAGSHNSGVVGKDLTGVAGRDISGTLNLNLAALRESEDPKDKELVDLIAQLRTAIEAPNCDLDDRFKQRALGYLDKLTILAKDKPQDLIKSAKDNLDDLADIADKGSKLANFAKEHLPTFTAAIAALRLWFGV